MYTLTTSHSSPNESFSIKFFITFKIFDFLKQKILKNFASLSSPTQHVHVLNFTRHIYLKAHAYEENNSLTKAPTHTFNSWKFMKRKISEFKLIFTCARKRKEKHERQQRLNCRSSQKMVRANAPKLNYILFKRSRKLGWHIFKLDFCLFCRKCAAVVGGSAKICEYWTPPQTPTKYQIIQFNLCREITIFSHFRFRKREHIKIKCDEN